MKVVLDTNVLVSGLLNPYGSTGEVLQLLVKGAIVACYDNRIFKEYEEVLARPKFHFSKELTGDLLDFIKSAGMMSIGSPLAKALIDPHDEKFLEIVLAGGAEYLITGNARHFPASVSGTVKIVSPKEFIEIMRKQ